MKSRHKPSIGEKTDLMVKRCLHHTNKKGLTLQNMGDLIQNKEQSASSVADIYIHHY